MSSGDEGTERPEGSADRVRMLVEDDAGRRPFMRGIMIHSLLERGVPFEDAYRTANEVREKLRGRALVRREELAAAVRELLGDVPLAEAPERTPSETQILVIGHGRRLPFSKGVLSQSLLAAAIDPNDAFDVARAIERQLLRRGTREVDRRDVRRIAFETLRQEIGPRIAERYLVWRRFQEPEKPVILLVGGAAGAGKTSLALEVAHRLGIQRVLSTDSIRQIMRIMLSPELMPAIHASSYDAYRVLGPTLPGADPVIEGFRAQASIVSVGVRAMMDRAVAENSSMILDGVSIVPGLIDLEAYAAQAYVVPLVVATLDMEAYRSRFGARAKGETHRPTHRYVEHLDAILRIQEHFLELADRFDIPIVDNESFERSVLSIIRHVVESLRKKVAVDAESLL